MEERGFYLPGASPNQLGQQQPLQQPHQHQHQHHYQQPQQPQQPPLPQPLQLQSPPQPPAPFMSPRTITSQHPYAGGAHHQQHHHLQQHHLHLQPTSQNLVHKPQHNHHSHHHHHGHHHHHCGHQQHQFRLRHFAVDYAAVASLENQQKQLAPIKTEFPVANFHIQHEPNAFGRPPSQLSAASSSPVATPTSAELGPSFRPRVLSVSGVPSFGASLRSSGEPIARQHSPVGPPLIIRSTSFSATTSQPEAPSTACCPADSTQPFGPTPPTFHQLHQQHHLEQQPPVHSSTPFAPSPAASSTASGGYATPSSVGQQHQHTSSMSPSDALNLGINLEQYISKRNERERSRVRNVNDAFDNLKNSLPLEADKASKRMSKVEILRTAIGYIKNLEQVLGYKQSAVVGDEQQQPRSNQPAQDGHQNHFGSLVYPANSTTATNSVQSPAAPTTTTLAFDVGHQPDEEPGQTKPEFRQDSYVDLMRSLDFDDFQQQQQQQPFE